MISTPKATLNRPMALAAALMALTTAVHVFAGGPEIHHPLQASDLPVELRAISAVLWHAITVVLLLFTLALLWMSRHFNPALGLLIVTVQLGFAALFLLYGFQLLGSPWPMPQWGIFLLIPMVMVLGMRGRT